MRAIRKPRVTAARMLAAIVVSANAIHGLGCEEEVPQTAPPVQPVKIFEIKASGGTETLEFPGAIRAAKAVDLAFENAGSLIELPVVDGQNVQKGEMLARLDPRDFESVRDAEKAKLEQAEADFERVKALFDADVTSRQEYDAARSQLEIAKANSDRALKSLQDDSVIDAPFSGTVAKVYVDNFQNVQAKQTILLLQNTSTLEVAVAIPESGFAGAHRTNLEEERDAQLKPVVLVSSVAGRVFPAKITEISPTADPTSRTYQAVVSFPSPPVVTVLPGMTASVRINVPPNPNANSHDILVPVNAATADAEGKAYVWKVDPASMQVSRVSVVLGSLTGDEVVVEQGLSAGDWIAVSGVHHLREGMRVSQFEG